MKHLFPPVFISLLSILLLSNPLKGWSQEEMQLTPFEQRIVTGFGALYEKGLDEKLYLQTDKPYYSASDTIWIKGHLVNAVTHQPETPTRFIYVELINLDNQVVERVKILEDSLGFHSAIALPAALPAGKYLLRGYTRWMENFSEDYFFRRTIEIGNTIDDAIFTELACTQASDGSVKGSITISNTGHEALGKIRVKYILSVDGEQSEKYTSTDNEGKIHFSFIPTPNNHDNYIDVESRDEKFPFKRHIRIPAFGDDFDVQFFPEGGHLLAGQLQRVAFKAIAVNGLGTEVSGHILNQNGDSVETIRSVHKGMGVFSFIPQAGESYSAEMETPTGAKCRFELPEVQTTGCAVRLLRHKEKVSYQLLVTGDIDLQRLGVIAHSRGRIVFADENVLQPTLAPTTAFDDGIAHIAVVDKENGALLSERLFFVDNSKDASAQFLPDRENYGKRQKVQLDLRITDNEGKPAAGEFALAVTDANSVHPDSLGGDIRTYLLLTSDLRGHIEDPGYYFIDQAPERLQNLDILLLTQGWRRFDLPEVLNGRIPDREIAPEEFQTISGRVIGFTGKAAKHATVTIMDPAYRLSTIGFHADFQLNENGNFHIRGIDIPEVSRYIVEARAKNGWKRGIELVLDPDTFPAIGISLPKPLYYKPQPTITPNIYLNNAKERYFNEGGIRVMMIDDIQVLGQTIEKARPRLYGITPTYTKTGEELTMFGTRTIETALLTLPSVSFRDNAYYIRAGKIPALMLLDDMEVDMNNEMLSAIQMDDVESIDVIAGADAAMFGGRGDGGVINIRTKQGFIQKRSVLPSVKLVDQLGFRLPTAFYQPKYEVFSVREDKKPDLRTTIAWEPIRTDSTGQAHIEFYTADYPTRYNLILEGVTSDGQILHSEGVIRRE